MNRSAAGRAARRKGRDYEAAVYRWLTQNTRHTIHHRNRSGYTGDDIHLAVGNVTLSIDAKNQRAINLAGWVDQAAIQAPAGTIPAVIHKRSGVADIAGHYVTLTVADLATLLDQVLKAKP